MGENLPAAVKPARGVARRELGVQVAATLQAAARSEHSQRAYRQGIGLFLEYLGEALGTPGLASATREGRVTVWGFSGSAAILRQVTPGHLDGFRAWRESQGDSPNTVSQRLAAVMSFLRVAYRDGIITDVAAQRLGIKPYVARQKRDIRPTGRRLSKPEVRALRAAVDTSTVKGKRDLLILDLALFAALRCDEIARLDLANIAQDGGRWWLVFAGKGQKTRKIKIHDTLYASLQGWLAATGRGLTGEGPVLWPVRRGDTATPGRLATSAINRLVAEYGAKAGLAPLHGEQRLGPHDLRRTCARNAYENGAPLPAIQRMLGHSDVSTTMRYIGEGEGNGGGAVDFVRYSIDD